MVLPKSEKLKNRSVFRRFFKMRKVLYSPYLIIYGEKYPRLSPSPEKGHSNQKLSLIRGLGGEEFPKIAVTVSKKQIKLAVNRNKQKRKIEEAYRTAKNIIGEENLKKYKYLVFSIQSKIQEFSFQEIQELIIHSLLNKSL